MDNKQEKEVLRLAWASATMSRAQIGAWSDQNVAHFEDRMTFTPTKLLEFVEESAKVLAPVQPAVEAASEQQPLSDLKKLQIIAGCASDDLWRLHAELGLPDAENFDVDDMIEAIHELQAGAQAAAGLAPVPPEGQEVPDLAKLKALALAATPGPWEVRHETDDDCYHAGYTIHAESGKAISDDGTAPGDKDALFIAAANPAVVLDLIDRVSRLSLPVEALTDEQIADGINTANNLICALTYNTTPRDMMIASVQKLRAILALAGERG